MHLLKEPHLIKAHVIEIERLDSLHFDGQFELVGPMDVKVEREPSEGAHESKLRMSVETAVTLHRWLSTELIRHYSVLNRKRA